MKNRIQTLQFQANKPIEDRLACHQLKSIPGYLLSVFDGHSGWQVSEFCEKNLPEYVDKAIEDLKKNKYNNQDDLIIAALNQVFDKVEETFLIAARQSLKLGFPQVGKPGSCALVAIVIDNKLYSANIGDCKGLIISVEEQDQSKFKCRKINHKQNAGSKKEQQRLKKLFPREKDIYVCDGPNSKACWVKNKLQPTRSFGDFNLKYKEFNIFDHFPKDSEKPKPVNNFNGPYITHKPEIQVFELNKNDKFIIMATDGLWDELKINDISQLIQDNISKKGQLSEIIFNAAIEHAAIQSKMSVNDLKKLPFSVKRDFHDDISIIIADLESQI